MAYLRWSVTAVLGCVAIVMAILISQPHNHAKVITTGGYSLAPPSGAIPTLAPYP